MIMNPSKSLLSFVSMDGGTSAGHWSQRVSVSDIEQATIFTPARDAPDASPPAKDTFYLGFTGRCGVPMPPLAELFALRSILMADHATSSTPNAAERALMKRLDSVELVKILVDLACAGIEWYFSSGSRHDGAAMLDASAILTTSTAPNAFVSVAEKLSRSSVQPADLLSRQTAGPSHDAGELAVLSLTLVCDALFVVGLRLTDKESHTKHQSSLQADDMTPIQRRRSMSKAPMPGNDLSTLSDYAKRIVPLIMLTSDALETEWAIRRCAMSLVGFAAVVARHRAGLDTALDDVLLDQQVHRHCPSHWLILGDAVRAFEMAALETKTSRSILSRTCDDAEVETDTGVASPNRVDGSPREAAHRVERIVGVLAQSTAWRSLPQLESMYTKGYGDPSGLHALLLSRVLSPMLHTFVTSATTEFWRMCTPSALLAYCTAFSEGAQCGSWRLCDLNPVLQCCIEAAAAESHSNIASTWISLHAAAVACCTSEEDVIEVVRSMSGLQGDSQGMPICVRARYDAFTSLQGDNRSELVKRLSSNEWCALSATEDAALSLILLLDQLCSRAGVLTDDLTQMMGIDIVETLEALCHMHSQRMLEAFCSGFLSTALLRAVSRHSSQLPAPLHTLEVLLHDSVFRKGASSTFHSERVVERLMLSRQLLRLQQCGTIAANASSMLNSLSLFCHNERLPLSVGPMLSHSWVQLVGLLLDSSPIEFAAALQDPSNQVLPVRLFHELANALMLNVSLLHNHVAQQSLGETVCVLEQILVVLASVVSCRHADLVLRHEVPWGGRAYSFLYVLLTLAFSALPSRVVGLCCALIIDGLEHYAECDARRRAETSRSLHQETRGTHSLLLTAVKCAVSLPERNALCVTILRHLAKETGSSASIARLLVLKAVLVYDTHLFHYIFQPDAPDGDKGKDTPEGSMSMLNTILQDTVTSLESDISENSEALALRDRAESLDILRRQHCMKLSAVQVVELTRRVEAHASTAANAFVEADRGALLGAACVYVAQHISVEISKSASKSQPSSQVKGPSSPSAKSKLQHGASPAEAAKRCTFVMTHGPLIDELLARCSANISHHMSAIEDVSHTVRTASDELQRSASADGSLNYVLRRVRIQYGESFVFEPLTLHGERLCKEANRLASFFDALTSVIDGVHALVLACYRDRDVGFLETILNNLDAVLRMLDVCVVPIPSLGWFVHRLLRSCLAAAAALGSCVHHHVGLHQSMVPLRAAEDLQSLVKRVLPTAKTVLWSYGEGAALLLQMLADLHEAIQTDVAAAQLVMEFVVGLVTPDAESTAPLSQEVLTQLTSVVHHYALFATPLQIMTLQHAVWYQIEHRLGQLHVATTVDKAASDCCSLVLLLEVIILEAPDAASIAHLPTDEVLRALHVCGSVSQQLDSFVMTRVPTEETVWHALWVVLLRVVRTVLLRVMSHGNNSELALVIQGKTARALSNISRFAGILSGPRRPVTPVSASINTLTSAQYVATIVGSELKELELCTQIAALLVLAPDRQVLHPSSDAAVRTLRDALCCGFAKLRKPSIMLNVFKQGPPHSCDWREMDVLAARAVRNMLSVLVAWSSEDPDWLLQDAPLPTAALVDGARSGAAPLAQRAVASSGQWGEWSTAVCAPVISLEMLKEYITSEFSILKRIHRDTPDMRAMGSSVLSGSPGLKTSNTPLLSGTISPGHRHAGDGSESVADSDTSLPHDWSPLALHAHSEATRSAVELFVIVAKHRASEGMWNTSHTGNQRDVAEKMEATIRHVLPDVTACGIEPFARFLHSARDAIEHVLLATASTRGSQR